MKENKNGFTLLELLVVVVIIGILAAIALPQYQMAVGKAKYAELKITTQSIAEALQSYYLVHGNYKDADIDSLDITIPQTISCGNWKADSRIRCCKQIFNIRTCFYREAITWRPQLCAVYSGDKTDKVNRFCQKETKTGLSSCQNDYCQYYY